MRALAVVVLLLALFAAPARAADGLVVTSPPTVTGVAQMDRVLTADPGTWSPDGATFAYRWLRDGTPIAAATSPTYRATVPDIGHRLAIQVTATGTDGSTATATSAPTSRVIRGSLRVVRNPVIKGIPRFTHTLTAATGTVRPAGRAHLTWWRGAIALGHRLRHPIAVEDVGRRLHLAVRFTRPGYTPLTVTSRGVLVRHRVPVRHLFTYHVETRGRIVADLEAFRQLAQQTYDDPRGWRSAGYDFRRVARGGDFTLVLAEAAWLPRFSSGCSSEWSCRAGRYVIINQTRWLNASPAWNGAHRGLRDYRNMVVNHETGHWLGHDHRSCPGPGQLAPVMMQQSKGTHGCRFNPWPLPSERWTSR